MSCRAGVVLCDVCVWQAWLLTFAPRSPSPGLEQSIRAWKIRVCRHRAGEGPFLGQSKACFPLSVEQGLCKCWPAAPADRGPSRRLPRPCVFRLLTR